MYKATRETDIEKVKQEAYLVAIDNTLNEVRNGIMEFISIDVNREIETKSYGNDIVDMRHTGVITISFTIRPRRKR